MMRVSKSPTEALALTNCVIVSPRDFSSAVQYIIIEEEYVFTLKYAICLLRMLPQSIEKR